jgi:hypothetical protein
MGVRHVPAAGLARLRHLPRSQVRSIILILISKISIILILISKTALHAWAGSRALKLLLEGEKRQPPDHTFTIWPPLERKTFHKCKKWMYQCIKSILSIHQKN